MARFFSFNDFLYEKEVPLSTALNVYSVEDLSKGKFKAAKDNVSFSFSVNPLPKDLTIYEKAFYEVVQALESNIPVQLYQTLEEIQKLPYHFGNIFSTSLSLSNVSELSLELTDEQSAMLKNSEVEFLKTSFASLPKSSKDAVLSYLKTLAEKVGVVLECLFYYTRSGDLKKFFQAQDFDSILQSYQKVIDIHQESDELVYDGPYNSDKLSQPVSSNVDYVYWKVTNKQTGKKWILRATTSPEILNSENQIGEKIGLNFSLLDEKGKDLSKEYQRFSAEDLEKKMKNLSKTQ